MNLTIYICSEWNWSENAEPPSIQLTKIVAFSNDTEVLGNVSNNEKSFNEDIDPDENIQRDQSFLANLDYLLNDENGASQGQLQEVVDQESMNSRPKGFVTFIRGDSRFFIKKASLTWMLSVGSKRVSTDRIYRFISDKKTPDGSNLQIGDFVVVNFENLDQLVQIISFRFCNGKKFYGDQYVFHDSNNETDVELLANFFKIQDKIVNWNGRAQRWINVKTYKRHSVLHRDLSSGNMVML